MRVSREQAAENRDRIVETAGRLFRERGFDGIGVADLMKAAGLTHGGFYGHFGSKEDLAAQACARALAETAEGWEVLAGKGKAEALDTLVARYLSAAHRDNPGKGCAFVALGADASRHGGAVRRTFRDGLETMLGALARLVPGRSEAARRRRAIATMAGMVGAQVLARSVGDEALSDEILEAVRAELGGGTPAA